MRLRRTTPLQAWAQRITHPHCTTEAYSLSWFRGWCIYLFRMMSMQNLCTNFPGRTATFSVTTSSDSQPFVELGLKVHVLAGSRARVLKVGLTSLIQLTCKWRTVCHRVMTPAFTDRWFSCASHNSVLSVLFICPVLFIPVYVIQAKLWHSWTKWTSMICLCAHGWTVDLSSLSLACILCRLQCYLESTSKIFGIGQEYSCFTRLLKSTFARRLQNSS